MFPFGASVCQDYTKWLVIYNNNQIVEAYISDEISIKNQVVEITEKSLEISFPKSENNNKYIIPDVTKASIQCPTINCDKLMSLSTSSDKLDDNSVSIKDASHLSQEDIALLDEASQVESTRRLVKIQKSKKFNRRRQSIDCSKHIRICNPDRFGLVDLSNWNLTQKYLKKYLNSWDFNIFRLNRFTGGKSTLVELGLAIFQEHDLINHFKFNYDSLKKFLYSVQSVYHNFNPYHNALHSADVAQSMHCFLSDQKIKSISDHIDILSCIIAALCHDADHPGLNQLYLEKINHFFVSLYNHNSVLENHHIRVSVSLLHQSTLLNFLSVDDWRTVSSTMCNLILATDITHQKSYLNRFISLHHEKKSLTPTTLNYGHHEKVLIYQMAIKCSDISNPCRCWPVSLGWASLVCEEFFLQGDVEKTQGLSVMSTHDRCMSTKADIQLGFIRFIVRPLVAQWNCFLKSDLSVTLVNHVELNLNNWESFKQRFVAIATKTLPNSSVKIEINCPPLSGLATLTEESTLASSCITRRNSHNQRRFSLPDNVTTPAPRTLLKSQQNVSTTITTFPRLSVPGFNRRSSLPQHPKSATSVVPEIYNRSRRGSLPLNSRAFPVPSAWDEATGTSNPSTVTIVKPNEHVQTRRGSAPLISYPRCGQDYSCPKIAKGCSREQLLLEVYWMTASSSVSSINSVHGASNSNIALLSSVHPQSSSSSSGHNDTSSEFVTIR